MFDCDIYVYKLSFLIIFIDMFSFTVKIIFVSWKFSGERGYLTNYKATNISHFEYNHDSSFPVNYNCIRSAKYGWNCRKQFATASFSFVSEKKARRWRWRLRCMKEAVHYLCIGWRNISDNIFALFVRLFNEDWHSTMKTATFIERIKNWFSQENLI